MNSKFSRESNTNSGEQGIRARFGSLLAKISLRRLVRGGHESDDASMQAMREEYARSIDPTSYPSGPGVITAPNRQRDSDKPGHIPYGDEIDAVPSGSEVDVPSTLRGATTDELPQMPGAERKPWAVVDPKGWGRSEGPQPPRQ